MLKIYWPGLLLIALLQPIQAFCIYNMLKEQIGVYIENINRPDLVSTKRFKKGLPYHGISECCHFSNNDCSSTRTQGVINDFEVDIWYSRAIDQRIQYNALVRVIPQKIQTLSLGP
ncbi:hypothetical protein BDB01DRAFT_881669 [Pilobolus umbonatus]|nr:hypothetical protein BDB01DRAFT_881669 [Pilobolus umbonatus]